MNSTQRLIGLLVTIIAVVPAACLGDQATTTISLSGQSAGGTLTFMPACGWNYPYVIVTNQPGDSSAVVLRRLAQAWTNCPECTKRVFGGNGLREVNDRSIVLYQDYFILGGTDTGFRIPPAPLGVTASYDAQTQQVEFGWINPPTGYDSIVITYYGVPLVKLPGTATRYVHRRSAGIDAMFSSDDIRACVLGYKNGVPSNGVGVALRRQVQLEAWMQVPFTAGVAPGYETWIYNTPAEGLRFEEGSLPEMKPARAAEERSAMGFYQIMRAAGLKQGGLARRFVGLIAGNTYRVSARLSVSQTGGGNWAFSLHAAANPRGRARFSEGQMAGTEQLPTGAKGPTAAQIARYDSAHHVKGQWLTRSSGVPGADNVAGDVTLPQGSDSLTVWFRLQASGAAETTVALDSLTIEDLGGK